MKKQIDTTIDMRKITGRSDAYVTVHAKFKGLFWIKLGMLIMKLGIFLIGFNLGSVDLRLEHDEF